LHVENVGQHYVSRAGLMVPVAAGQSNVTLIFGLKNFSTETAEHAEAVFGISKGLNCLPSTNWIPGVAPYQLIPPSGELENCPTWGVQDFTLLPGDSREFPSIEFQNIPVIPYPTRSNAKIISSKVLLWARAKDSQSADAIVFNLFFIEKNQFFRRPFVFNPGNSNGQSFLRIDTLEQLEELQK
jgi:hypothetical protein